jgi:hypothetical protein
MFAARQKQDEKEMQHCTFRPQVYIHVYIYIYIYAYIYCYEALRPHSSSILSGLSQQQYALRPHLSQQQYALRPHSSSSTFARTFRSRARIRTRVLLKARNIYCSKKA